MNVLLITPIYPPQAGGAATHFKLITDYLREKSEISKIIVVTRFLWGSYIVRKERNTLTLRVLPFTKRSDLLLSETNSSILNIILKYVSVFIVNSVVIFFLPLLCCILKVNILHYHRKGIYPAVSFLSRFNVLKRLKIVLDCQDMSARLPSPYTYDKVVCSSKNVYAMLKNRCVPENKLYYIPLPFKRPQGLDEKHIRRIRRRYKIFDEDYILFLGDIITNKGIYELIDAFKILSHANYDYCKLLVLAGENKEGNKFLGSIKGKSNITYLGSVGHTDALALIRSSKLVILPSKTEGLPRVCLEAISLERKVICPPGIPEFDKFCPDYVLNEISSSEIQKKIVQIMHAEGTPTYPFNAHDPENSVKKLFSLYRELLSTSFPS